MIIRAALLALLLTSSQPAAAAQVAIELTDANVVAKGGGEFLLEQAINEVLFRDVPLQGQLRRVGVERGCLFIQEARRLAVESHREDFRAHLLRAMRAIVPAERMARSSDIIIGGLIPYRRRVEAEIRRSAATVFERAIADARSGAVAALSAAPAVPAAESAGRFADWRLDQPLARQIACNLIIASQGRTAEEFARMRSAFDGFYRRSGE